MGLQVMVAVSSCAGFWTWCSGVKPEVLVLDLVLDLVLWCWFWCFQEWILVSVSNGGFPDSDSGGLF